MKLEIGKRYRTQNGSIVKIKKPKYNEKFDKWAVFEKNNGNVYGNYLYYNDDGTVPNVGVETERDYKIIAEVEELKLEVGKSYRTKEGHKVVITHKLKTNFTFWNGKSYNKPFEYVGVVISNVSNGYDYVDQYNEDGVGAGLGLIDSEDPDDIIGEWVEKIDQVLWAAVYKASNTVACIYSSKPDLGDPYRVVKVRITEIEED